MALAALPVADIAGKGGGAAAQVAAKALTADIVVINGKYYREIRTREPTGKLTKGGRPQMRTVRRLEPISYDIHINPVSVLLGAAGALLLGGIGAWMFGLGIKHEDPTVVINGTTYHASEIRNVLFVQEQLLADAKAKGDKETVAKLTQDMAVERKALSHLRFSGYSVENRARFQGLKLP